MDKQIDTIVRVDRSVRPVYPDWVEKVMHPELENIGPAEYDLATQVSPWFQRNGMATGKAIYDHLKESGMFESCLGLSDAVAIQKLGVDVFKKVFGDNEVYFWKSVVQGWRGSLYVPYFVVRGDEVVLDWRWLGLVAGTATGLRFFS